MSPNKVLNNCLDINFLWLIYYILLFCSFTKIANLQPHDCRLAEKSIFGKFLSIPETLEENFDFLDFLKDDTNKEYLGVWNLYFVKRDHSSDILGLKNIDTGKLEFEAGVVYELSDDKFIYNLMNFKKHDSYKMTNIFDILKKNYVLTNGVGESGGYHALIFISKLFSEK